MLINASTSNTARDVYTSVVCLSHSHMFINIKHSTKY